MARTIAPASPQDVLEVQSALVFLRRSRDCLTRANSPNALAKVQSAIKSTEGALRHVEHRLRRADPAGARLAAGDLAQASAGFRCQACGRPEFECSESPCDDVAADRES